jgi:UDP-N-acetylglucosamine acyltransferase
MSTKIHPTSIIDPLAQLADDVEIGPYCIIRGPVRLAAGCRLIANVQLSGPADIDENVTFYPFCCVGFPPQDFKFKTGDTTAGVRIGKGTILRENTSVHAASKGDNPTIIGERVFMMVSSHVGHDARVGNNVILANSALLAGHCIIGDNANLSGNTSVHQFTRVGRMAFLSGQSATSMDVPPFCVVMNRSMLAGVNLVGLRRAGYPREQITAVREAYRFVFRRCLPRREMIAELERRGKDCPLVQEQAEFVASAKRPIAHGRMDLMREAEILE